MGTENFSKAVGISLLERFLKISMKMGNTIGKKQIAFTKVHSIMRANSVMELGTTNLQGKKRVRW